VFFIKLIVDPQSNEKSKDSSLHRLSKTIKTFSSLSFKHKELPPQPPILFPSLHVYLLSLNNFADSVSYFVVYHEIKAMDHTDGRADGRPWRRGGCTFGGTYMWCTVKTNGLGGGRIFPTH
jgi:hypothetical protein